MISLSYPMAMQQLPLLLLVLDRCQSVFSWTDPREAEMDGGVTD